MFADVGFAIDHFSKLYSRRRQAGQYVDGRWEVSATADDTIQAAIFSVKPDDVMGLPEGERLKVSFTMWTRAETKAVSEEAQTAGDLILVGSQWHRVKQISDRAEGGYFKALLERHVERSRSVSSTPSVVDGGDWH